MKRIIRDAGTVLKKRYFETAGYRTKEKYHLLSDTDLEMNEYLTERISKAYPGYNIISEEIENIFEYDKAVIVDPIDGTANYITGMPYFTISVAVVEDGAVAEGHVYNPVSREYYYSRSGMNRSYLNGNEIRVSAPAGIEDAVAALGCSYRKEKIEICVRDWDHLLSKTKKTVFRIAPAQTICNVARGRLDLFIDGGCSVFGQSAASLILRNAGGAMMNYDMSEYSFSKKGGIFCTDRLAGLFA